VINGQFQGGAAIPTPLVAGVDHEAPDIVLGGLFIETEHDEAHRLLAGVDGAEPGLRLEVGLRDRDGVAGDESLLLGSDLQVTNGAYRLGRDFAQGDVGGTGIHGYRTDGAARAGGNNAIACGRAVVLFRGTPFPTP
jgi:hypothetical protein